jgi:hypothetical protein
LTNTGSRPPFWSIWGSSNNDYLQEVGPLGSPSAATGDLLGCGAVQFDDVEVLPPGSGDRALLAMRISNAGSPCGSLNGAVLRQIEPDGVATISPMPWPGRFAVGASPLTRTPYALGISAAGALELSGIAVPSGAVGPPLLRLVTAGAITLGDVTGSFNPAGRPFFTAVVSGASSAQVTDTSDGGTATVSGLGGGAYAVVGAGRPALLRVLGPVALPAQRMPVVGVPGGVVVLWSHRTFGPALTFVREDGTLGLP